MPLDEIETGMDEQRRAAGVYEQFFSSDGLVTKCLDYASSKVEHIMDFTRLRALGSLFSILNQSVRNIIAHNQQDFKLNQSETENFLIKSLLLAVVWSFSGDSQLKYRNEMGQFLRRLTTIELPDLLIDYTVELNTGEWLAWSKKVPQIEIEPHKITATGLIFFLLLFLSINFIHLTPTLTGFRSNHTNCGHYSA